jgi:hypothetical protein
VTTFAELEVPTVVVTPGEEATTTLVVRNDSEIVEAYQFEVIGAAAPWTTVEPSRLTLYPGTSEPVTLLLRPPRTPEVAAGEVPLGVRVLPTERPDSAVVSETTVLVQPFWQLRAELVPRRRRAWRSARYRVALHNQGNAALAVGLVAGQADERMRFTVSREPTAVGAGATADAGLRVRLRSVSWFGKPASYPFQVTAVPTAAPVATSPATDPATAPAAPAGPAATLAAVPAIAPQPQPQPQDLDGELVQLALLPRWLLALLAAIVALLLAWFALVRPTVRSAAREAADTRTQEIAASSPAGAGQPPAGGQPGSGAQPPAGGGAAVPPGGAGASQPPGGSAAGGAGGASSQSSNTIEVRTRGGRGAVGRYTVPAGKVLRITDIVVANPQGDEGLITIVFGARTITVIALETFRNQDYHWVTPIDVPAGATVNANVSCGRPGTPASGRQAATCLELLNVNGELNDLPQ